MDTRIVVLLLKKFIINIIYTYVYYKSGGNYMYIRYQYYIIFSERNSIF